MIFAPNLPSLTIGRIPVSHVGFGERASRFAMIIDDLKVTYIGIESGGGVSVSGAEAVLAKL
jgi:alkyl hydroperoxide reductase 1